MPDSDGPDTGKPEMTDDELQAAVAAALPDLTTPQQFAALEGEATIHRDAWGIPHIRAGGESDLYFAQGFATAQDRLWHMDADRYQALGRWSERVGPRGLARDRLLRAAGMGRTASLDLAACSDAARAMVDAYTAGVNAFIDSTTRLPIEYTLLGETPAPWEPWHCVAVYKIRNSLLGTFEPKLWRSRWLLKAGVDEVLALVGEGSAPGQLLTVPPGAQYEGPALDGRAYLAAARDALLELSVDPELLVPGGLGSGELPADVDAGSNGWSISGERTTSGQPLMGGDSHRALDTPNVYYQVHLACPDFDVIGHSVPGVPGALHFCHNQHVAWGMTHGAADTQDLFLERFRDDGREVEAKDGWRPAKVTPETLRVRDGDDVQMDVTVTDHGPVIAGDPRSGWGVAICDPGLIEGTPWLDAARDAMHADSIESLHHALRHWNDRVNNYAVADTQGHFGYLHEGRIPIRGPANGWAVVPGWTGEYDWQGVIAPDDLPQAVDPDTGWAVTCNQRVTGHEYPHYVGLYFASDHRACRVRDRLLALAPGGATVEDMAQVHAERLSLPAQVFVERLLAAVPDLTRAGGEIPPQQRVQALKALRSWDLRMDRHEVGPTIYSVARRALMRRLLIGAGGAAAEGILTGEIGGEAHVRLMLQAMHQELAAESGGLASASEEIAAEAHGSGRDLLPPDRSWDDLMNAAFDAALVELAERLGDDVSQWRWGRLHHTQHRHPLSVVFPQAAGVLDPASRAVHGDGDTPLAGSYGLGSFVVTGGSVNRYLMDPSDWTQSRWIVPLGASGHPASGHYADQASRWAELKYIPMLWDWTQIEAEAESEQVLSGKL